jgi:hypothetical protein
MPSYSFVTILAASSQGEVLVDDAAIGAQQHGHHDCSFEVVILHQQADKASLNREAYRQQAIGVTAKGPSAGIHRETHNSPKDAYGGKPSSGRLIKFK